MQLHLGWSSETGNTVDLLREFIDHCNSSGIAISSVQQITQNLVLHGGVWVFFVSTTGQGSPPHNMRAFWKQLMRKSYKLPQQIEFCMYSLGDSSYGDDFGMTARKLRQRLRMLGAVEIAEIGLGDDQDKQGYRDVYLSGWRDNVCKYLRVCVKEQQSNIYSQRITLRDRTKELQFVITDVEELSGHKGRRVYWVELSLPQGTVVKEGETIQIYPHNRSEDVEYMLNHLKADPYVLVPYDNKVVSVGQLLREQLNISSVLNYYFFANSQNDRLLCSVKEQLYRDKVQEFITNYEQYFNFFKRYKRNITEFLSDFQCQLDLDYLVNFTSEVVGRKYSVARVHGNRIWLLVKLVEQQIAATRLYKGVCSHDLIKGKGKTRRGRLVEGDITPRELRGSNILIAMGTGIAPFIWALDHSKDRKFLLFYTNSFPDEIYHRILVKNKDYEQVVSCTREAGLRMIRLLQSQSERLISALRAGKDVRILYCGPKEIYEFILTLASQVTKQSIEEVKRSKLIVYQNW